MSRIIKFRSWDESTGMMRYPTDIDSLHSEKHSSGYMLQHFDCCEQFTGRTDTSDRDIYEGDIVTETVYHGPYRPEIQGRESRDYKSIVTFEADSWCMLCLESTGNKCAGSAYGFYDTPVTIIGNIHQNPELLTAPAQRADDERSVATEVK